MTGGSRALLAIRLTAAVVVARRLARAGRPLPPVRPVVTPSVTAGGVATHGSIAVVIPARDEEHRIGPVLAAAVGAPGVDEVVVVDDGSSDGTAAVAAAAGATVVAGRPPPGGWAGKAWALQQGIEAVDADWVVTLDADTRPHPSLPGSLVARSQNEGYDLLTVGGRFDCPTAGARWLHPAMLTTLVYRFGPVGAAVPPAAHRTMANGQCMVVRRDPFLASGGMAPVAGEPVEDVALARMIAAGGGRVGFLDASEVLTVRMYDDARDTWRGWGRSLALPGVEPPLRQLVDLATVALTQPLPALRLVAGRGDPLDIALVALRVGTLAGTARAYERKGPAFWLSPTADLPATVALAIGTFRRRQTWRGRTYVTRGHASDGGQRPLPERIARRRTS